MRIVFFGSGAFGTPTLSRLASDYELIGVVSQPDRRAGRGGKTTPTPVSAWAQNNSPRTPLLRPERVNEPEWVEKIRSLQADAWVVIAYGQKLSQDLLKDRFAINLHASLLPRWRGAAPINAAILAGDEITGNSVITLAEKMDAGLILGQTHRPIEPDLTAGELHDLLSSDGPDLVCQVLQEYESGSLTESPQDESLVTFAPKLGRTDAWLDFSLDAPSVRRRVHGLTPWPGVTVEIDSTRIRLLRVKPAHTHDQQDTGFARPGMIIDTKSGLVQCGSESMIQLVEIQPVGKKPMSWKSFINGHHIEPNTVVHATQPLP